MKDAAICSGVASVLLKRRPLDMRSRSAMRIWARGSPGEFCHSGTGAGCQISRWPIWMRRPISVAVMLFAIDQLSSCVSRWMPGP